MRVLLLTLTLLLFRLFPEPVTPDRLDELPLPVTPATALLSLDELPEPVTLPPVAVAEPPAPPCPPAPPVPVAPEAEAKPQAAQ